ncbi:OLC1v1023984C1 [Oldenlandia corymbosa var. corymbosa]|uniref:OLC1v1023984C1 n=1 Tax=Oldenlandia corymbosa var. corymbosa TaxID=529605 RepID=A0AAV1C3L9_OLDCO|nr:OLC1v1023984C1 [Oldenlandia corymbosa var. corymbosa]
MTRKTLLRCFASSSLNPFCKTKSVSVTNGGLGAVSAYFYSAGTAAIEPSSPSNSVNQDTLFQRLMRATDPKNPNQKEPVSQVLKRWVDEGREIDIRNVLDSIKMFRKFQSYERALEISEWIGSFPNSNLRNGIGALHLDLIYKVHGLEQAERYFESAPDNSKDSLLYGALLNCYVKEKLLDKAEPIMEKIREFGYGGHLSYNGMLNLYSQLGKWVEMISLVQEMESKGIHFDSITYSILLNAYGSTSDIMRMDKLLLKMEADPCVVIDWWPYSISAKGYLRAGDTAKAVSMLKKCEHMIEAKEKRGLKLHNICHAYEVLMTQYASMGKKDEVDRIWKLHKKPMRLLNRSYTCAICSHLKMDDTAVAQKLLNQWFSKKVVFDIRIPNLLVAAFCKKGQMEEAESIVKKIMESGAKPYASTWHYMASGYVRNNQMEDAVKMTIKGLREHPRWRPDIPVLACFEYLKGKGDNGTAEEILRLLEEGGGFGADFIDLISKYMRKGDSSVPAQMENGEEKLLDKDSTEMNLESES